MIKKFYRISYKNIGIYEALKQHLWNINESQKWDELEESDNFKWLMVPNKYSENSRSYFTELGYRFFMEKTFPVMNKYLNEFDISIDCFEFDYLELNIIYEDTNQIVIE